MTFSIEIETDEKIETVFLRIWLQKFILAKNMKKKLLALAYMLRPGLTIPILCTCMIIVVIRSEKFNFLTYCKFLITKYSS